jgi:hypothetical protein
VADADRLALLAEAVTVQPGVWTTRRVQRLYHTHGVAAPQRATARRDLAALTARGLLVRDDTGNNRQYHRKGDTS